MNNSEKKAFIAYKLRAHSGVRKAKEGTLHINNKMPPSIRRVRQEYINIAKIMNKVFAKTRRGVSSNGPSVIYRGLAGLPASINNRSFSSWSSKQNIASTFKNNKGILLRMNTRHLKNIPIVSYKNNINKTNVEFEYILPPMKFMVTSINKNYVNVIPI
jgi:hypothetical protein